MKKIEIHSAMAQWIEERLDTLSILEEEAWMRENSPQTQSIVKPRKF